MQKKTSFFYEKKHRTYFFFTPPPPPPPPAFSRALRRAGFVVGCLAAPNGGLRGAERGSVRIGPRRPVGLDAPTRL
jgi:hypothetical protein